MILASEVGVVAHLKEEEVGADRSRAADSAATAATATVAATAAASVRSARNRARRPLRPSRRATLGAAPTPFCVGRAQGSP